MKKTRKPLKSSALSSGLVGNSIPLDLLCEMAWRVIDHENLDVSAEAQRRTGLDQWRLAIVRARALILRIPQYLRNCEQFDQFDDDNEQRSSELTVEIQSKLNGKERDELRVAFERGCQLVTGIKKKRDAVTKFERLSDSGYLSSVPTAQFRLKGFALPEIVELRLVYELMPRDFFRKPYQRTGRYRGKAKKMSQQPKKSLSAIGGKKPAKSGKI
jgi:hypothetical protein